MRSADKELLDAASGSFSPDGQFQKDGEIPHTQGALFGWRLRLACNDQEVRFTETVVLPGPGDWNTEDNSRISDDRASATVTSTEVCNRDGWIEKVWGLAEGDPLGSYTIIVKVEGYREQQFKLTVVGAP